MSLPNPPRPPRTTSSSALPNSRSLARATNAPSPGPLIRDVPDTAFMVAGFRALESARPDALFRDDLADRLAGERGREIMRRHPRPELGAWTIAVRTVVIDDYIASAIARGVDTIINLGAGLDTRPYRLELPPTLRWVEADFPSMIAHKADVLADETPRCALERVAIDLADRAAQQSLLAEIAARASRVLVLTEGVLPYLQQTDVAALADYLHAHACFEAWIVDYISPAALHLREQSGHEMEHAPFRFRPADWAGFFAAHGWRPVRIRYIPEAARELRRPAPLSHARRAWLGALSLVGAAPRPRDLATFMGYAELARA